MATKLEGALAPLSDLVQAAQASAPVAPAKSSAWDVLSKYVSDYAAGSKQARGLAGSDMSVSYVPTAVPGAVGRYTTTPTGPGVAALNALSAANILKSGYEQNVANKFGLWRDTLSANFNSSLFDPTSATAEAWKDLYASAGLDPSTGKNIASTVAKGANASDTSSGPDRQARAATLSKLMPANDTGANMTSHGTQLNAISPPLSSQPGPDPQSSLQSRGHVLGFNPYDNSYSGYRSRTKAMSDFWNGRMTRTFGTGGI